MAAPLPHPMRFTCSNCGFGWVQQTPVCLRCEEVQIPDRSPRIIGRNRYELYLSILVVVIGFFYSAVRPQSFSHVMVSTGSLLIGLVCAINAISDYKRMSIAERIFALAWLVLLMFAVPWALWDTVTTKTFSFR
jgi:hypothetical protein